MNVWKTAVIAAAITAGAAWTNAGFAEEPAGRMPEMRGDGMTMEKEISIFPLGDKNDGYAQYFTGQSYLHMLNREGVAVANVTFEPSCRNHWHVHHKGGQILLATAGRGWYQAWGEPARELHPGDVVYVAPEVKHWHGAAKDSWFAHVAIEIPAEGASNEWQEEVTDEEYGRLP